MSNVWEVGKSANILSRPERRSRRNPDLLVYTSMEILLFYIRNDIIRNRSQGLSDPFFGLFRRSAENRDADDLLDPWDDIHWKMPDEAGECKGNDDGPILADCKL